MAREFSSKNVKDLIAEHDKLLNTLNSLASLPSTIQKDVQQTVMLLLSHNVFQDIILQDLDFNNQNNLRSPGTDKLITLLFQYQKTLQITSAAKQMLDLNQEQVRDAIQNVRPGKNGIMWFFASKSNKDTAAKAYNYLKNLLEGSYGTIILSMSSDSEKIQQTSIEAIWADMTSNTEIYQSVLDRLFPKESRDVKLVQPVAVTLKKLDDLTKNITTLESSVEENKEKIKTVALKLAAEEALKILRDVPVEQINKERGGIRVKKLRDNGYATMADIYTASVYQIASINGISEDAAYTIKRAAHEVAELTKANSKIKLSSDNRSRNASDLVTSIYAYKIKANKLEKLHELVQEQKQTINQAQRNLYSVGDGSSWLFFSDSQRDRVRSSYRTLNQLLNGEFAWQANQLITALRSDNQFDDGDAWRDFERNNIEYYTILEDIVPGILGNDDNLYGLPEELAREIQEEVFFPDGLLCTLRRYQEFGVKYILHQERVLLGDEMGLGKTVQAIASMVSLRNTGATHFIVVCPASVVTNWCREVTKHSKLRVTKIHGAGRSSAFTSWQKTGGVAVTTYETTSHLKMMDDFSFDMLVVDEAHYIKNPEARRTKNVKELCSHTKRLLFMTGTALENKVEEMIELIRILRPNIASSVMNLQYMSASPQFREKVAPVYYRRKREEVLTELPELIESKEWCTLSNEEEQIYEQSLLSENYAATRRVSWNVGDLKHSCKAARLIEIISEAEAEDRKVIVFSFFLDTIRGIGCMLGAKCYGPINGSVPPQRRQEIIDDFNNAPPGSVLLAQIQAGGTGLNIQSASVVVICEPQFKPSIENQAISRAYRMGQARNVLVYRLLCENTVDERITDMLEQKQAIFNAFADKSVAAEQDIKLDEKSFGQIIQEEIDRINKKNENQKTDNA